MQLPSQLCSSHGLQIMQLPRKICSCPINYAVAQSNYAVVHQIMQLPSRINETNATKPYNKLQNVKFSMFAVRKLNTSDVVSFYFFWVSNLVSNVVME